MKLKSQKLQIVSSSILEIQVIDFRNLFGKIFVVWTSNVNEIIGWFFIWVSPIPWTGFGVSLIHV